MQSWWADSLNAARVAEYEAEYGPISGQPLLVVEDMNFNISHGVKATTEAATCGDCHTAYGSGDYLNWTQLGYSGDPNP